MNKSAITILGIESSCDDTAAAICQNGKILANIIAGQDVHQKFGGVVPELASRAHQQNIVPVVEIALQEAKIKMGEISGIAFTRGPGLLGSLLVGTSFAKGLALSLDVPLIDVNHMQAHILAHFITENNRAGSVPKFPFLCLTVSGGHTQIVLVRSHYDMEVLGKTLDDAAGEAFDKAAKILGLPYPGGPLIDRYAQKGNPDAFRFPKPEVGGLNFSFSGLKTAFLYFIRDKTCENPAFVVENLNDLCASVQSVIVEILIQKLVKASEKSGVCEIALAGGVSANTVLRKSLLETGKNKGWNVFIPKFEYCTDNAAMIAVAGYYKYLVKDFCGQEVRPDPRWTL